MELRDGKPKARPVPWSLGAVLHRNGYYTDGRSPDMPDLRKGQTHVRILKHLNAYKSSRIVKPANWD